MRAYDQGALMEGDSAAGAAASSVETGTGSLHTFVIDLDPSDAALHRTLALLRRRGCSILSLKYAPTELVVQIVRGNVEAATLIALLQREPLVCDVATSTQEVLRLSGRNL